MIGLVLRFATHGNDLVTKEEFAKGQIAEMQSEFGQVKRWRVDGFYSNSRLRLRPLQLSAEGLSESVTEGSTKIIDMPGWRPAINKLLTGGKVTVIRRDSLGRVRLNSAAHLPVTWKAE